MWDVFICHASEDKDQVARPIAKRLKALGLQVWYDEFTLSLGDSLRESIDYGLANSKFGIVILSPNFFKKNWPQKELDGLFAREVGGDKIILPVWHNIDRAEILKYSPIIADKIAANTSKDLDIVIKEIMKIIDPQSACLSDGKHGVVVTPASFDLARGNWKFQSSFTINNKTDDPVHSVCVKGIVISNDLESLDILFELMQKTSIANVENEGDIKVEGEVYRVDGYDSLNNKVIFLFVNTLGPRDYRTFIVKSRKPVKDRNSRLIMEVHGFQSEPVTILTQANGKIAFPIHFNESITVESISIVIGRK